VTISLLRGWFFPTLVGFSLLAAIAALGRRSRRWRHLLPLVGVATFVTLWGVWMLLHDDRSLQPAPPLRLYLWGGAAIFVIYAVAAGWRSASVRQRLFAAPAVVLSLTTAAVATNYYYGYYPTLDSVFGEHYAHQVSIRDLEHAGYLGHGDRSGDIVAKHDGPASGVATGYLHVDPSGVAGATGPSASSAPKVRWNHELPRGGAQADAGRLVRVDIPGTVSGFKARRAWVYLPPVWFGAQRPQLPVVLMLAGTPGSPSDWIRAGQVVPLVDQWARAHGGRAPIFVFADQNGSFMGDTECVDRPKAMVDTYLSVDVPAFVAKNFDAATDAKHWAVEGLSEGGTCAITLALRHPNQFGSFADVAGERTPSLGGSPAQDLRDLYGGSRVAAASYDPASLLVSQRYEGMGAFFGVGSQDGKYIAIARDLARLSKAAGAHAVVATPLGHHTFRCFASSFRLSLPWLAHRLGESG
jgi:S-formylglutathione hydrolase FrmB